MRKLPYILLYSRLFLALIILACAYTSFKLDSTMVLLLIFIGILTDIFDGIIARKLNISTNNLRIQDTIIDLFFFLSVIVFIFNHHYFFIESNTYLISLILLLELSMYVTSLYKFKKLPSPHSIPSKFWGIYLIIEFSLILLNVKGNHFEIALFIGILIHLDRLFIYLILKNWDHDIPSSYHAYQIRSGKKIKRIKLFNG